jgi:vancomycin resistance protein YoaR
MGAPTLPRFLIASVFLGGIAGGAYYARAVLPRGDVLPGVRVDGALVPPNGDVRALAAERAAKVKAIHVRLMAPDETGGHVLKEATLEELGVDVDVDAVARTARGIGQGADILTEYELVKAARAGRFDVPLHPVVDPKVLLPILESFKEQEDVAPISARLDLDRHTVVPEKDGKYLDVDAGMEAVQRVAQNAASYAAEPYVNVVVPFNAWKPHLSSEFLSAIDIHEVVASFETTFSRGQQNRSRNVEVAASRINGVVLSAGASMSFNEIVGARSTENGFQKAGEIFKGEMIEGVGGGTCQVASTLHAIAFFGGLDIVERLPHSRPSG